MKSAFTLLEMTVVLILIAVATHLAVREFSRVKDGKLALAADRQLEEVRAAVWSVKDGEACGFLADTGRMPRLAGGTLSELWMRPADVLPYSVKTASRENLRVGEDSAGDLEDESVYVPTGWRGPYIKLPSGQTGLRDPWGNPLVALDSAGFTRVWETNSFASAVSHYGPDSRESDRRTVPLAPEGGIESTLVVSAEIVSGEAFAGDIAFKWYGPASGYVTGGVARAVYPSPVRFTGLTPGMKVLTDSLSRVQRPVLVRPGDNYVHIRITR